MKRTLNNPVVEDALSRNGLSQKDLAGKLGVSAQAITNWLQGVNFPRPPVLLKLAALLNLPYDQLVVTQGIGEPIVAYRKRGNSKTTAEHIRKSKGIGHLLRPLVPLLPAVHALRTQIASPSLDYNRLQASASELRRSIGIGDSAELEYNHLIQKFAACGAILVPVLWGKKSDHKNAMHLHLPDENITFIYLNLDTREEDFKFWMAHELAHVLTPGLTGTDEGEDFAEAFAATLLFPEACAAQAYSELMTSTDATARLQTMAAHAQQHQISLNTVYQQAKHYALNHELPPPGMDEQQIHVARNQNPGPLVSENLFDRNPPEPDRYLAACENIFASCFFEAVKRIVHEQNAEPEYLQQILDISLQDAYSLHKELSGGKTDSCSA